MTGLKQTWSIVTLIRIVILGYWVNKFDNSKRSEMDAADSDLPQSVAGSRSDYQKRIRIRRISEFTMQKLTA